MAPKRPSRPFRSLHRSSASIHNRTEIKINVYDLLPPGKLSSVLWTLGTSLLHSGVVINGKEYAFGGHDRRGITGVYWTKPQSVPPGASFKCEILHGFTYTPQNEIDAAIREASEQFLGTAYDLLRNNCNHFTMHLLKKLTDRPGPGWLNRAASIGVTLPCIVPRDWIDPPDLDTDGSEDFRDDDDAATERSRMLRSSSDHPRLITIDDGGSPSAGSSSEGARRQSGTPNVKGKSFVRDSSGRQLPVAEQAPT